MTKKPELPNLIGSYLSDKQDKPGKQSKPSNTSKQDKPSKQSNSSKPDKPGTTRATYIVRSDYVEKLKALAYYKRIPLKDVINDMISKYLGGEFTQEVKKTWETK